MLIQTYHLHAIFDCDCLRMDRNCFVLRVRQTQTLCKSLTKANSDKAHDPELKWVTAHGSEPEKVGGIAL